MIDLISLTIDHSHKPFGSTRILKRENKTGNTKLLSKKIFINHVPVIVTSLNNGSSINIRCCPLKVLQGHNVFGTNSTVKMWVKVITETLKQLEIKYSEQQLSEWIKGEFDIDEIHITHRFPVSKYPLVRDIISHIRRYSSEKLLPTPIRKGVGVSLRAPHGQADWLFYDKHQEFNDKRTKEQKYLQAVIGDAIAQSATIKLLRTTSKSIRAELKLGKQYLIDGGRRRAASWKSSLAIEVFTSELGLLGIGGIPALPQLPEVYAEIANPKLRAIVILWANGEDITNQYAPSTVRKYRAAVLDELGIDIMKDQPVLEPTSLNLSAVFDTDQMLVGFPKWARNYPAIAFR